MGESLLYCRISLVEKLLYSTFSGGDYIAIFTARGKMAMGKDYYITPVLFTDINNSIARDCMVFKISY